MMRKLLNDIDERVTRGFEKLPEPLKVIFGVIIILSFVTVVLTIGVGLSWFMITYLTPCSLISIPLLLLLVLWIMGKEK